MKCQSQPPSRFLRGGQPMDGLLTYWRKDALAKLLEINLARAALNSGEEEVEIAEDSELGDD